MTRTSFNVTSMRPSSVFVNFGEFRHWRFTPRYGTAHPYRSALLTSLCRLNRDALRWRRGMSGKIRGFRLIMQDRMRPSILGSLAIVLLLTHQPVGAQRRPAGRPQLQGVWNGATSTPLERPAGFEQR